MRKLKRGTNSIATLTPETASAIGALGLLCLFVAKKRADGCHCPAEHPVEAIVDLQATHDQLGSHPNSAMNIDGFALFAMVLFGLLPICQGGRWRWDVMAQIGSPFLGILLVHRILNTMFWLGWSSCLILSILMVVGLWPTGR